MTEEDVEMLTSFSGILEPQKILKLLIKFPVLLEKIPRLFDEIRSSRSLGDFSLLSGKLLGFSEKFPTLRMFEDFPSIFPKTSMNTFRTY